MTHHRDVREAGPPAHALNPPPHPALRVEGGRQDSTRAPTNAAPARSSSPSASRKPPAVGPGAKMPGQQFDCFHWKGFLSRAYNLGLGPGLWPGRPEDHYEGAA